MVKGREGAEWLGRLRKYLIRRQVAIPKGQITADLTNESPASRASSESLLTISINNNIMILILFRGIKQQKAAIILSGCGVYDGS